MPTRVTKPKPVRRRKSNDKVYKEPTSNIPDLIKHLVGKSKIKPTKRAFQIRKLHGSKVYQATINTTGFIRQVSLDLLKSMFKRHRLRLFDGSVRIDFARSRPSKSVLSFKFTTRSSKRKNKTIKRKPAMVKGNIAMNDMTTASALSQSLTRELLGLSLVSKINHEIEAADDDDGDRSHLKVLKHGDAARAVMDLYTSWISDKDFTYFTKFMKQIDDVIYKFRGNKAIDLSQMDNEDDEDDHSSRHSRHSKHRKKKHRGSPVKISHSKPAHQSGNSDSDTDTEPDKAASDNSVVISEILEEARQRNEAALFGSKKVIIRKRDLNSTQYAKHDKDGKICWTHDPKEAESFDKKEAAEIKKKFVPEMKGDNITFINEKEHKRERPSMWANPKKHGIHRRLQSNEEE